MRRRLLANLYSGHVYIWNYTDQTVVKSFEVTELPGKPADGCSSNPGLFGALTPALACLAVPLAASDSWSRWCGARVTDRRPAAATSEHQLPLAVPSQRRWQLQTYRAPYSNRSLSMAMHATAMHECRTAIRLVPHPGKT